ncbi:hypothetical protein GORHZ_078_00290 [Gordonia rhizosphera NBRC 16068]|uniref:Uncharacterized protein n=1 Tax=Gordonia rhizosphera NBRC 16068 TaxID=1108045 RepID=K6V1Z4_9ACTN|nr:hypothetical protein GORHZ_078_00290 [Gordonia rhizosphera NBRC 16068]
MLIPNPVDPSLPPLIEVPGGHPQQPDNTRPEVTPPNQLPDNSRPEVTPPNQLPDNSRPIVPPRPPRPQPPGGGDNGSSCLDILECLCGCLS